MHYLPHYFIHNMYSGLQSLSPKLFDPCIHPAETSVEVRFGSEYLTCIGRRSSLFLWSYQDLRQAALRVEPKQRRKALMLLKVVHTSGQGVCCHCHNTKYHKYIVKPAYHNCMTGRILATCNRYQSTVYLQSSYSLPTLFSRATTITE